MTTFRVEYTAIINARPEQIWAIFTDYRVAHKAILPKPYFVDMVVTKGGQGAGTMIDVYMQVMGVKRTYHMVVSEPEPGRVLCESDLAGTVTTYFTLDPLNHGTQTRVTILSENRASAGMMGMMERWMNPPITRKIYKEELDNLAAYVRLNVPVAH